MGDIALRVDGLGKMYHLGAQQQGYKTLGDQFRKLHPASLRTMLRRGRRAESKPPFWALKDVSFEVKRGEVVGVIGRNGAGKSTLLKILSRITEPTEGGADIHGRVGSLLEVGTGFHPELTGRENIYLNGAILGMKRAEIVRKFDEIVAFAEVEKFIDTPVKYYSSGMYVRLAFAVAAHLEPDILIVDEVLAVGDAQFQKKCLGRMGEVAKDGRTVLFVSHNMSAVRNMCSKGILLQKGHIASAGEVDDVFGVYNREISAARDVPIANRTDRTGSGRVRLVEFGIHDAQNTPLAVVRSGTDVIFRLRCIGEASLHFDNIVASIGIGDSAGNYTLLLRSTFGGQLLTITGQAVIECRVAELPLAEGTYWLTLYLSHRDSETLDCLTEAFELRVEGGDYFGTGSRGLPGLCRVLTKSDWRVN